MSRSKKFDLENEGQGKCPLSSLKHLEKMTRPCLDVVITVIAKTVRFAYLSLNLKAKNVDNFAEN